MAIWVGVGHNVLECSAKSAKKHTHTINSNNDEHMKKVAERMHCIAEYKAIVRTINNCDIMRLLWLHPTKSNTNTTNIKTNNDKSTQINCCYNIHVYDSLSISLSLSLYPARSPAACLFGSGFTTLRYSISAEKCSGKRCMLANGRISHT